MIDESHQTPSGTFRRGPIQYQDDTKPRIPEPLHKFHNAKFIAGGRRPGDDMSHNTHDRPILLPSHLAFLRNSYGFGRNHSRFVPVRRAVIDLPFPHYNEIVMVHGRDFTVLHDIEYTERVPDHRTRALHVPKSEIRPQHLMRTRGSHGNA